MTRSILFVCLGNICRSPAAEAVFLDRLHNKGLVGKYRVDSAGTGAWHQGSKADPRMLRAAMDRGIHIASIARKINIEDLKQFDLILTMDDENFSTVKAMACELEHNCIQKIKPILSYSKTTSLREVPDPYYGGENGFNEVLDLLEDACDGLLEELTLGK